MKDDFLLVILLLAICQSMMVSVTEKILETLESYCPKETIVWSYGEDGYKLKGLKLPLFPNFVATVEETDELSCNAKNFHYYIFR